MDSNNIIEIVLTPTLYFNEDGDIVLLVGDSTIEFSLEAMVQEALVEYEEDTDALIQIQETLDRAMHQ